MLKYLIILLDDSSVSYCHYDSKRERKLISKEDLKKGVRFAMIENLNVQFVWPDYELPEDYKEIISSIDHVNIVPVSLTTDADVIVAEQKEYGLCPQEATVVAPISLSDIVEKPEILFPLLEKAERLNIVISDPESFHDSDIEDYRHALSILTDKVFDELKSGHDIQVNIITDRMGLTEMNNCNAGWESITLAPDGNFYICPAFYYAKEKPVGSIEQGLYIKNPQLFRLDHSPICRNCDAWQCRRCVWLNKKYTLEVNTPGHEQCVMAHLEREAARKLREKIKSLSGQLSGEEISELNYLDPFDKIINNDR
ncbi:MAG: CXXX repeat peptide maturase [Muribaculaceae bacterium]|nr:CXXX repeat peptide maturase [Muribaculaceae bacterium]